MTEQYIYGGISAAPAAVQQKTPTNLRTCQECNYVTFSHYIKCPRCSSEKWSNR